MTARQPVGPDARAALDAARLLTAQVREARDLMCRLAAQRREAVLLASREGASPGLIARTLGISPGNAQQLLAAARHDQGPR